jgi:3-oxoacyl-ACP reductase-like protein
MRTSLEAMTRLAEIPRIAPLHVDPSVWNSVSRFLDSYRNQLSISDELHQSMTAVARRHDLPGLAADVLRAARDAEQQEAVEALEVTAEVLRYDSSADEIGEAFAEKVKPMFSSLEARLDQAQPTVAEKLLLLLVSAVITLAMQAALVQLGVPLDSPHTEDLRTGHEQQPDTDRGADPRREPSGAVRRDSLSAKDELRERVESLSEAQAERLLQLLEDEAARAAIGRAIAEGYRRIPQTADEDAWAQANAREAIREERW